MNSDTEWIYCKTEMKKKRTKKQNKVRDIHGSIPGVKPAGTQLQGMTASIPYDSEGEERTTVEELLGGADSQLPCQSGSGLGLEPSLCPNVSPTEIHSIHTNF